MVKNSYIAAVLAALAFSSPVFSAPERVGDFALLDQNGDFHQFSRYKHKDAIVLFSQANDCSSSVGAVSALRELRAQWEGKNVAFLMVNSAKDDLASIREASKAQNLDFPIMLDSSQLVADTLGINKAGEVLVLDPERLTVLYRGPVHENIVTALNNDLSGVEQDTMSMEVAGCDLNLVDGSTLASNVPDYASEVAPIIVENCAECHREGGIGPFAMNSHLMLQG